MPNLKEKLKKAVSDTINGLSQSVSSSVSPLNEFDASNASPLLRYAAAQGAVLLKNDNILPLAQNQRLSVFGRVQADWFYTGYGSGGDVTKPYAVSLADGLLDCTSIILNQPLCQRYIKWSTDNPVDHGYWGHWPRYYPEMPLSQDEINGYSSFGNTAAVVIGRSSGEDRENVLQKGSYYLTDDELSLIKKVTSAFEKCIIILNIGSVIDLSWLELFGDKISAVLLVWQGGMESGNAVADILCGKSEPCGRLSDTFVKSYKAYPSSDCFGHKKESVYKEDIYVGYRWFETFDKESVLFPFGFGLGYTDFSVANVRVNKKGEKFTVSFEITNIGRRSGRHILQLYTKKPCGKAGNPSRCLTGFFKTKQLDCGEAQKGEIEFSLYDISHYDEEKSAYVVGGSYTLYLGNNVRDAKSIYDFTLTDRTVEQLSELSAPKIPFDIYTTKDSCSRRCLSKKAVRTRTVPLKKLIKESLPVDFAQTEYDGSKLCDVADGKISVEKFVSMLDCSDLEALTRGDYTMNSPLGTVGNAGALAGVTDSLRKRGVPPVITTDGPSGMRLNAYCSLIPMGTLLACTFDTELVCDVFCIVAREMKKYGSDVLLAPGMNIHRNPLCGRNFEYYSEDPLLTGKIAAAAVKGIQSCGSSACPKHFACNNQETNRNKNDSVISERALREIYLKGFEICVKQAKPKCIMTSYNKVNGVWSHYNYELCTEILRNEWGFNGCVITDWWMQYTHSPEFKKIRDNAYRVRSQVDVLMPGGSRSGKRKPDGTLLESLGKNGGITIGEIQRSAINVLRFTINIKAEELKK